MFFCGEGPGTPPCHMSHEKMSLRAALGHAAMVGLAPWPLPQAHMVQFVTTRAHTECMSELPHSVACVIAALGPLTASPSMGRSLLCHFLSLSFLCCHICIHCTILMMILSSSPATLLLKDYLILHKIS